MKQANLIMKNNRILKSTWIFLKTFFIGTIIGTILLLMVSFSPIIMTWELPTEKMVTGMTILLLRGCSALFLVIGFVNAHVYYKEKE